MSITLYFRKIGEDDRKSVFVKYFVTLAEALSIFNQQFRMNINILYNEFGQVIPLTYNIQKTGLIVYYLD